MNKTIKTKIITILKIEIHKNRKKLITEIDVITL